MGPRDQYKALAGWSQGRNSPVARLGFLDIPRTLLGNPFVDPVSIPCFHMQCNWGGEEYFVTLCTGINVLMCLHLFYTEGRAGRSLVRFGLVWYA